MRNFVVLLSIGVGTAWFLIAAYWYFMGRAVRGMPLDLANGEVGRLCKLRAKERLTRAIGRLFAVGLWFWLAWGLWSYLGRRPQMDGRTVVVAGMVLFSLSRGAGALGEVVLKISGEDHGGNKR